MNITGRLTRDAEVRTLKDNRQVVNFSVAVRQLPKQTGRTCGADRFFRLLVLDNPECGKATDQRLFGRTHRKSKRKGVDGYGRQGSCRIELPYLTNQIA